MSKVDDASRLVKRSVGQSFQNPKSEEVLIRHLRGERVADIAASFGVSRARVYQLLAEARKDSSYSVHVQIKDARGQEREDIARYLKAALAEVGIATHSKGEEDGE